MGRSLTPLEYACTVAERGVYVMALLGMIPGSDCRLRPEQTGEMGVYPMHVSVRERNTVSKVVSHQPLVF